MQLLTSSQHCYGCGQQCCCEFTPRRKSEFSTWNKHTRWGKEINILEKTWKGKQLACMSLISIICSVVKNHTQKFWEILHIVFKRLIFGVHILSSSPFLSSKKLNSHSWQQNRYFENRQLLIGSWWLENLDSESPIYLEKKEVTHLLMTF